MSTEYGLHLHPQLDLVSVLLTPPSPGEDEVASECSFQLGTSAVASLLDFLSVPVTWRWSCVVNGWVNTPLAVLTIRHVAWQWVRADDGTAVAQVLGNVLDHGYASAEPSKDWVLLATLSSPQVPGFRGALAMLDRTGTTS